MKVPVSWLREYVEFALPVEELGRRLVFTSCEVDRIVRRGVHDGDGNLGRFRVGRVLEAAKHPNADRLQLCSVDVGEGDARQIVCGAWNFGAGATVPVALPGAGLANGLELEQRKVRGELSDGMILAEDEIDLGLDHTGIMLLDPQLEPGTPLADALPLADDVLEIETGYNRPDLTSVYGIAREVSALLGVELAPPPGRDPEPAREEPVDVRVEDLERCPRYIGRLFRSVAVGDSPPWLKARLLGAGMRPISNVVDVTNYVMLALGSPLHAFDHARLAEGRIVVRRANQGERIRTLDGPERAEQVVGIPIPGDEQRRRLTRLGFEVSEDWTVSVPAWRRRDVRREIDLVEEVARFRLEEVPATMPERQEMFGRLSHEQRLRRAVSDLLVGCGFCEVYTYSLLASDPDPAALVLPVPLSEQQRVLRTTLLHGLVRAAQHNVDVGNSDPALFEVAHVYLPTGGPLPREPWRLAAVMRGGVLRAKGVVEEIFALLKQEARFEAAPHPFMASPACASVQGGWVAQLDPRLIEGEWSAFELDLEELFAHVPERVLYRDVITFPAVKEDLAFVVDEAVPAGALIEAAR